MLQHFKRWQNLCAYGYNFFFSYVYCHNLLMQYSIPIIGGVQQLGSTTKNVSYAV